MKLFHRLIVTALAGFALAEGRLLAQAQVSPTLSNTADRLGRVIVVEPVAPADISNIAPRPELPERQRVSDEIRKRLARFEVLRNAYLKEQADLRKRERGATTDEERDRIRELIRRSRDAWIDRTTSIREELKDRIATVRDRLPSHDEVLRNAKDNAQDAANRRRRGTD